MRYKKVRGATLTEALVASVIVITIIGAGFVFVQKHLRNNYKSRLKLKIVQQVEEHLERSIEKKELFSNQWEEQELTISRSIATTEIEGFIKLELVAHHTDLAKPIIIARIVRP